MILLLISSALAATAADMAAAMEIPSADIASATMGGNAQAYTVSTGLGTLQPQQGNDFAWLYTGRVGAPPELGTDLGPVGSNGDRTALKLSLDVPAGANSMVMDFFFLSAEYPEYVGSVYNDTFEAKVSGSAWSGNAAQDSQGNEININTVLFAVTQAQDLKGTGFENLGGGTGWLSVVVPVDPSTTVGLELMVYDVSDGILDSAVALDDFYWSESDIDVPVIVRDISLDFLSPKRGSVDGGVQTTVYGEDLNPSCEAWFDGVKAPTVYVDAQSLLATPEPHAAGLVDVTVKCVGVERTLGGGYTYYEEDAGDWPPVLLSASPYNVSVDGGELVELWGEAFVAGAVVLVDGVEHDTSFVDEATLRFTTQAHGAGLAAVTVTNPDGLADTLEAALQFTEGPYLGEAADSDPSSSQDSGLADPPGGKGTGCSTTGLAAGLWLLGLVAVSRRRA